MNILLNGGFRFDFSNGWSYTLIYTYFMLIIFVSLKLMCDNGSQSLLPKTAPERWWICLFFTSLVTQIRKQTLATVVAH